MEQIILQKLSKVDSNKIVYNLFDQKLSVSNTLQQLPDQINISKHMSINRHSLNKMHVMKVSNDFKGNIMERLFDTLSVPFEIISWIESKCNKCYTITFLNVTVHILFDNSAINYTDIHNIFDRIVTIIHWILSINENYDRILNIFIFMSEFEKHINAENPFLGYYEINSGMSYNDYHSGYIQIFRKEELYKVLIHELMHNLGMDIHYCDDINNDKHIPVPMFIDKSCRQILLNEAYTELVANYLHSVFYAYKHEINLEYVLRDEIEFSKKQSNKLLHVMKITSIEYFKSPNAFKQYTNALSYYIIKYFLMNYTFEIIRKFNNKQETYELINNVMPKIFDSEIYDETLIPRDLSMKMIKNDFL